MCEITCNSTGTHYRTPFSPWSNQALRRAHTPPASVGFVPSSYQQAVLELLASRDDGEELSQAALDMITDRLHEHVRRKYPTLAGAVEDLAQDALVRFLRAVAAGRVERPARDAEPEGDEKPELYLLKTLERLCLDALRRSDRVRAATTRIEVTDDDDLASNVAGRVDAGALVRKAIAAALTAATSPQWPSCSHGKMLLTGTASPPWPRSRKSRGAPCRQYAPC
jgi:DNA-directed RNA polymerase specialized sigma24 family protein